MNIFDSARAVANAVLYEGYLLYPYTASARKNQQRWQFGVIMPHAYEQAGTGEPSWMQTEVLLEAAPGCSLSLAIRFLHLERRTIEDEAGEVESLSVDGKRHIAWEEAVEREIVIPDIPLDEAGKTIARPIEFAATERIETIRDAGGTVAGRIIRRCDDLQGRLTITAAPVGAWWKLRVRIENQSHLVSGAIGDRTRALRAAFISAHVLLGVSNGRFVSALDPPDEAEAALKACKNERLFPVLVGASADDTSSNTVVLASPIILYDYPQIAPESEGDKFDATEIDELLNLSVLALSDEEKAVARATDDRARAIVDRAEAMPPEHFAKLHGALRSLEAVGQRRGAENGAADPYPADPFAADPFAAHAEGPAGGGHVVVNGLRIETGSHVRLRPVRRADVWDAFLEGKTAKVAGVYEDFEAQKYVAVTVDDDPATEMHEWYGRYLFFYPNEVEPLEGTP